MSTYVMTHGSTEYRRIKVTVTEDDGDPVNPTVFPVQIAFTLDGVKPVEGDWLTASWVTVGSTYYARILVGPDGGVNLSDSDHHVWVRVDAGAEYPYMFAGILAFL